MRRNNKIYSSLKIHTHVSSQSMSKLIIQQRTISIFEKQPTREYLVSYIRIARLLSFE